MLAAITVDSLLDNTIDDGLITLREAILATNTDAVADAIESTQAGSGADTITFSVTGTINLASQLPTITEELTITGPGASLLTLDAGDGADNTFATGDGYRIFNIDDGDNGNLIDVQISGLTLTGGDTLKGVDDSFGSNGESGGAILSFENLTITNSTVSGNATGRGSSSITVTGRGGNGGSGGGIFTSLGDLVVMNSTISGNVTGDGGDAYGIYDPSPYYYNDEYGAPGGSSGSGGGIYSSGNLTITGSTISGNMTGVGGTNTLFDDTYDGNGGSGGGIFSSGTITTNATITNSTINSNSTAGLSAQGGGIRIGGSFATIIVSNSTINNNSTTGDYADGGGILIGVSSATITVSNSLISSNFTTGYSADGGGIQFSGSNTTLTVIGSEIRDNSTTGDYADGGGINHNSNLTVIDSSIRGNSTTGFSSDGGGIQSRTNLSSRTTTVANSTISGNSTQGDGGGINNALGLTVITSSTITANTAPVDRGSGVNSDGTLSTRTEVSGSIIAGNTNEDLGWSVSGFSSTFQSNDFNLIGSGEAFGGGGNVMDAFNQPGDITGVADPMLDPLANNGGPTQTHALMSGSPAIDVGDPSITQSLTEFDQRGSPYVRVSDGDETGGARIDIGSFELQSTDVTAPVVTVDSLFTNDPTPQLTGTIDDLSATITIDVGSHVGLVATNNGNGTWTLPDNTINTLADDTYDVVATATDAALNVGIDDSSDELTIDATPPVVTADVLLTTDSTPELTGMIDDLTATITVDVGGQVGLVATNVGDFTWTLQDNLITTLADNTYDVVVTATDAALNVGTDASSDELTIDTTAPVVTVDFLFTSDSTPQLTGTIDDLTATITVDVSGQVGLVATNNGNGTWTLTDDIITTLADGIYDVMVTATDAVLNVGNDATTSELMIASTGVLLVDILTDENDGNFLAGDLSLREAIGLSDLYPDPQTITFDGSLDGGTILLDPLLGEMSITDAVTIDAINLIGGLIIDAGDGTDNNSGTLDGYRIFNIDDGDNGKLIDVFLGGLTLTGGDEASDGGAILNRENLTVTGTTISGNSALIGGGINSASTLNITNSNISGNSAASDGGGIFTFDSQVTITNSTIGDNSASDDGGGIYIGIFAQVTIDNSTISGNSASSGGGINAHGDTVTITNSTISGNSASASGGGINEYGQVAIANSTISGNSATAGGGINSYFTTIITNTIVAANTASSGPDIRGDGINFFSFFNLIGDGTGQTALIDGVGGNQVGTSGSPIGPLLGPLADNGGPTETHALLPGSPAIDTGDPAFATPPDFDQRGAPFGRVVDIAGGGDRIDIGAVELQEAPASLVVDTLTDELDTDFSPGDLSLREAIGWANVFLADDTITFDGSLDGGTILLDPLLGELAISDDVTIDAISLTGGLIIDAGDGTDNTFGTGDGYRIFNIDDGNFGNLIDVQISSLMLTGGDEDGEGGAIRSLENLTVTNSSVSSNSGGSGGGIMNRGTATIANSTISGNSGERGGGIYNNALRQLFLTNSTISGNTATSGGGGGGIYNDVSAQLFLTNSTVSGNSGSFGGGIYSRGTATIANSIITGNNGNNNGNEILNSLGAVILNDYNLLGNSSETTAQALSAVSVGANDVTATSDGTIPTALAAILNPTLADNGGPTETHALMPGSPAIDAGDPSITQSPTEFDQRGSPFLRVSNGDSLGNARIDIGAFETPDTTDPTVAITRAGGNPTNSTSVVFSANFIENVTGVDATDFVLALTDTATGNSTVVVGDAGDADLSTYTVTVNGVTGNGTLGLDIALGTDIQDLAGNDLITTPTSDELYTVDNIAPTLLSFTRQNPIANLTNADTLVFLAMFDEDVMDVDTLDFAVNGTTTATVTDVLLVTASTYEVTVMGGDLDSFNGVVGLDLDVSQDIADLVNHPLPLLEPATDEDYTLDNTPPVATVDFLLTNDPTPQLTGTIDDLTATITVDVDGQVGLVATNVGDGTWTLPDNTISPALADDTYDVVVMATDAALNVGTDSTSNELAVDTTAPVVTVDLLFTSDTTPQLTGTVDDLTSTITIDVGGQLGLVATNVGDGTWTLSDDMISPALADDTYDVVVMATDAALNVGSDASSDELMIDTTPPVVTVDFLVTNDPTPQLTGTVDDASATITVDVGGQTGLAAVNNGDGTWTLPDSTISPPLAVDTYDVAVTATDLATNAATDATIDELITQLQVDILDDESDGDYSVGDFSLREAIELANGNVGFAESISFSASLEGGTILLTQGELGISDSLTIDATSLAGGLTIDAQQNSRIFNITATTGDFTFAGLTLTGGRMNIAGLAGRGGAIRSLTTGVLTIDQSTIVANKTDGDRADGGGIWANGDVTLTQSDVRDNSTNLASGEDFGYGGGILSTGNVTLIESTVSGNSTNGPSAGGGGIFASGNVTLVDSTVSANRTTASNAEGGGINASGSVMVTNSTVSGNSTLGAGSADGGGIYAKGDLTISHSTITNNSVVDSSSSGGGIWNNNDSITIVNSIVAGNTAGGVGPDLSPGTGSLTVDYSLIGSTSGSGITGGTGTGNILNVAPQLDPLADNGGPTETHALQPSSPVIDFGDPAFSGLPDFDQRGAPFTRTYDSDGLGGVRIDMGAVEAQPVGGGAIAAFDADPEINGSDFLLWQQGFGITGGASQADGDATFDGEVTISDLQVWELQYGTVIILPGQFSITDPTGSTLDTTPSINWSVATDADYYNVRITSDPAGNVIVDSGSSNTTSYEVGAPLPLGDYFVFMAAINSVGSQVASNNGQAFTILPPPPEPFTIIGPSGTITDLSPTITWTASANATEYNITITIDPEGTAIVRSGLSLGTEFDPGSDLPFFTYYTFVEAENDSGSIDADNDGLQFTIIPSPLSALSTTGPAGVPNAAASSVTPSESFSTRSLPAGPALRTLLASSDLVDVALALALKEEADRVFGKREIVEHSSPLEFFSTEPIGHGGLQPVSSISSPANATTASSQESESPETPVPWEDAFDEVFASVF